MQRKTGTYITQKGSGESYQAYVPAPLPPKPPVDLGALYPLLEKATLALGELNTMARSIPNISLFIYMYVRKEALLSSQIEGTQSSFSDLMLFEQDLKSTVSLDDVEEVSHYVKAMTYGLTRLKEGFPLSLRLLKEIHGILLQGGRGASKLPGEFRRSQNWIGGTRPGNALFVPPPVDHLDECLSEFEKFLHDETLPILIKVGLAHVQFETIHPFLDGNGRLGRLLMTLLLCHDHMLDVPILYLSLYLKQNRSKYYELLQEVRQHGTWENWLEFFLEATYVAAKKAVATATRINQLFDQDMKIIESLGRVRFSGLQIFDTLKKSPQVTVPLLSQMLKMSAPTVRSVLTHMVGVGILDEAKGHGREKVYVYRQYLNILEEGAEPF